ncbi:MAG: GPR endopeptidase [Oscillospiraceae bacterium]|nr:GPR endopeptidase [Oscillospiraceae bacterium]
MLKKRTDLAVEAKEIWAESADSQTRLEGVEAKDGEREGIPVTVVKILDQRGANALEKPVGTYITLTIDDLNKREKNAFERTARALAAELAPLLPHEQTNAPVLVAGLGNREITPDAIGPEVTAHTMVTRHLVERLPEHFGSFRPVSAIASGVLGTTGVESGDVIRGVAERVKPACIIVADALTSRSLSRVCRTIQIADSGIVPGSGVGNSRAELSQKTMGVPVIAVGVPTVVDAGTLAADIAEEAGAQNLDAKALHQKGESLMVTPKDIDARVTDLAKVVGYGINLALQEGLDVEDITMFLS